MVKRVGTLLVAVLILLSLASCGGETSDEIINSYRAPVEKINLGYLSNRITYISENAIELKEDEHIFSVICAR